ncbi:serine-threonine protein kinase, putative [Entamoeba histolytica HM-3:IMSS]|uniref:Serine-threonine protein kinase, putative n=1 Tax=Entamoeba histolytica HM-3:IMSS TaxID=885315 RepID=M7WQU4_ENTHI|nr:serine-threonine protein kinase, putative [Entamoeba histolytica HM-3:IMSS]
MGMITPYIPPKNENNDGENEIKEVDSVKEEHKNEELEITNSENEKYIIVGEEITKIKLGDRTFQNIPLIHYKELHIVLMILNELNKGNYPNLYEIGSIRVALLLWKHFFLSLPNPVIEEDVYNEMLIYLEQENFKKEELIQMEENALGKKGEIKREVFDYTISFINELIDQCKMNKEMQQECANYFLNCLCQGMINRKSVISLISLLSSPSNNEQIIQFESTWQYEGEFIEYCYNDVYCPFKYITTHEMKDDSFNFDSWEHGKLFLTNYRIKFVPDNCDDSSKIQIISTIGQIPINYIASFRIEERNQLYGLVVFCRNFTHLFFGSKQPFDSIDKEFVHIQYQYQPFNEYQSKIFDENTLNDIVQFEYKRIGYSFDGTESNSPSKQYKINAPIVEGIECSDTSRVPYVAFQTKNKSKIIQFSLSSSISLNSPTPIIFNSSISNVVKYLITFPDIALKDNETYKTMKDLEMRLFDSYTSNANECIQLFDSTMECYSNQIDTVFQMIHKILLLIQTPETLCVLLPNKSFDCSVNIVCSLIELMTDSHYRTFDGFVHLFLKNFVWNKFPFLETPERDFNKYFILYLACVLMLIQTNPNQFEFNNHLIKFFYYHCYSKRFIEFLPFQVYGLASVYSYLQIHKNEFINTNYLERQIEIPCTKLHLNNLFSTIINPYTYNFFTLQSLQSKYSLEFHHNLVYFPLYDGMLNNYTSLTSLNLSNNHLTSFPQEITVLTGLISLNLQNNHLTVIDESITSITNLKNLNLANNDICHLPMLQYLSLDSLNISYNPLVRLHAPSLQTFVISGFSSIFPITIPSVQRIIAHDCSSSFLNFIIKTLPMIKFLSINSITKQESLPFNITSLVTLEDLSITDCGIERLPYGFQGLTNLTSLNLKNNKITHFPRQMTSLKNLKVLSLIGNPLIFYPRSLESCCDVSIQQLEKNKNIIEHINVVITGSDTIRKDIMSSIAILNGTNYSSGNLEHMLLTYNGSSFDVDFISVAPDIFEEQSYKYCYLGMIFICGEQETGKRIKKIIEQSNTDQKVIDLIQKKKSNGEIEEINLNVEEVIEQVIKNKRKETIVDHLLHEIKSFEYKNGILRISELCNIFRYFEIPKENDSKMINSLKRKGIFTLDGYRYCLVDYSIMDKIRSILATVKTKNGIVSVMTLQQSLSVSSYSLHFVLHLMHSLHVILLVDDEFFKKMNIPMSYLKYYSDHVLSNGCPNSLSSDQSPITSPGLNLSSLEKESSEKLNSSLIHQTHSIGPTRKPRASFSIGSKRMSLRTLPLQTESSISSPHKDNVLNSPRSDTATENQQQQPNYLIFNTSSLTAGFTIENFWPSKYHKMELEIGRVYEFSLMPREMYVKLLAYVSIYYKMIVVWKRGIICSERVDSGDIFMYFVFSQSRQKLSLRLRYLMGDDMTLESMKLFREIEHLLSTLSNRFDIQYDIHIMCSCCVTKDKPFLFNKEQIKNSIKNKVFEKIESDNKEHYVVLPLFALDLLFICLKEVVGYCLSVKDVHQEKVLTRGSSSIISVGHIGNDTKKKVVIKEINVDISMCHMEGIKSSVEEYLLRVGEFIHEVYSIQFQPNENLARVYNYVECPMMIIMEYFEDGNLFEYIEHYPSLSYEEVRSVGLQIANGIKQLHLIKHIHRDLKTPNILVELDSNKKIKRCALTDFGETIPEDQSGPCNVVECPYWLAPEVILNNHFTEASDVFSFGMILWELYCWSHPFPDVKNLSVVRDMVASYTMPEVPQKDVLLSKIIHSCWEHEEYRSDIFTVVAQLVDTQNFSKSMTGELGLFKLLKTKKSSEDAKKKTFFKSSLNLTFSSPK